MAKPLEANHGLEALKEIWAGQSLGARAAMIFCAGALVVGLGVGVVGLAKGPTALRTRAKPAETATEAAALATRTVDGPVSLSLEKGTPDPAGKLRAIVAGHVPTLQIGYRWFGILKEQSIEGIKGPQGWTAHFSWSRTGSSGANIDVFDTQQHAADALRQVMDGPASLLLIPNPDGKTRYVAMDIAAPNGGATYDMRCAVRTRSFYCSTIPAGVPAIVTVQVLIDTVSGPSREEVQAKVAEMTQEMGAQVDEVMRSLAAQGLDGTRAVAP